MLVIDGSHGEGGGQILRTALALSAISARAVRIVRIRANRPRPGLATQHLTSVHAVAGLCDAEVAGAELGAAELTFVPRAPARAGPYDIDVAAYRKGGSAGAVTLILQAMLLPLAFAEGTSRLFLRGGTHVSWSPPFAYIDQVWLPALQRMGVTARAELLRPGWYPAGEGEVTVEVTGSGDLNRALSGLDLSTRGPLRNVLCQIIFSNLHPNIPARLAQAAEDLLSARFPDVAMQQIEKPATTAGIGICLTADYGNIRAGFNALGQRGKPAEDVAREAVEDLIRFDQGRASVDEHLADQLLLPMALADRASVFTAPRITDHMVSNAHVIERFGMAGITMKTGPSGTACVTVQPRPRAGA